MPNDTSPSNGEQREGTPSAGQPRFGTASGVFVPTLLTILGVIMYLREGWVIGQVGLLAGWGIILLAFIITGCTALSMSSVATNIRVGAGGAYSIISQSLGIEIGGAIGIPLYLSQTLAVAMYVFGFRAGWMWIFPTHPPLLVDLITFGAIFVIAFVSAGLAFRIQYLILAIIVASLVSVVWAAAGGSMQHPVSWGPPDAEGLAFPGNFWTVFAVFFPAATGIMAGANMSGDLKDPRKSIPVGTLSAIVLSLVVYMLLGYWLARSATTQELRNNYTVLIDKAAWAPIMIAGLLGATFSSAMGSIVGAPRILQALASHRITPLSSWLQRRSGGEPRHALYISGGIVLGALMLRDLNAIAPLITMFFLITYTMINTVVFLEQQMSLLSFRPLFGIPRWIPPLGIVGCIAAMFIVNPPFGLIAVVVVLVFYGYLVRRHLKAPFGDVRSGVFVSVAEWAAKKASRLPENRSRGWKTNLLVPILNPARGRGEFGLLHSLAAPRGSVHLLGLTADVEDREFTRQVKWLTSAYREEGVFASAAILETENISQTVLTASRTLEGAFFRPNVIFLPVSEATHGDPEQARIAEYACRHRQIGLLLYAEHAQAGLGRRQAINLHLRPPKTGWDAPQDLGPVDLAGLACYKLHENWQATFRLVAWVARDDDRDAAREYLRQLISLGRLEGAQPVVRVDPDGPHSDGVPPADLHCMAADTCDLDAPRKLRDELQASCLIVPSAGGAKLLA
jgi:amino acid transporter